MHTRGLCLVELMMATLFALAVPAAEHTYYERFTQALTNGQRGFLTGTDLVNTNNPGPCLTTAPISFKSFTSGELARIKLGMTMSEVVEAWGRPHSVFSHCGIGPRFWYVPARYFGDVSLSFRGNRLVLIAISGETARHLAFDNGLSGNRGRADYERTMGQPVLRDSEDLGLYNGEIAYRRGPTRISFEFQHDRTGNATGRLEWAAVCLEAEAKRPPRGAPDRAANQSGRTDTNQSSPAAGLGGWPSR